MPAMELPEIETERLLLRQFAPDDLDIYAERIFADPQVTRGAQLSRLAAREQQQLAHHEQGDGGDPEQQGRPREGRLP